MNLYESYKKIFVGRKQGLLCLFSLEILVRMVKMVVIMFGSVYLMKYFSIVISLIIGAILVIDEGIFLYDYIVSGHKELREVL